MGTSAEGRPAEVLRLQAGPSITKARLYELLRHRVEVFVVEQASPYRDLDGLDLASTTTHAWLQHGDAEDAPVLSLVRLVDGLESVVLGRVVTPLPHRGQGYASRLVRAVLERVGDRPVRLGAQTQLEEWYARFGFVRSGEDYVEDGIPHLPMLRPATPR